MSTIKRIVWTSIEVTELLSIYLLLSSLGKNPSWQYLADLMNGYFKTDRTAKSIENKIYKINNLTKEGEDNLLAELGLKDEGLETLHLNSAIGLANGMYEDVVTDVVEEEPADEVVVEAEDVATDDDNTVSDEYLTSPASLTEADVLSYQWFKMPRDAKYKFYLAQNKEREKDDQITFAELNEQYKSDRKYSHSQVLELENILKDIYRNDNIPKLRNSPKIGRNDKCPCGSGKKYKHCCGKE